jgi:flagellin FlaB
VLINTAGFLQSQAEATGEESTSQVSDGINVYSSVSNAQNADSNVTQANLRVGLSSGSNPVDLTDAEISAVGPQGTATDQIASSDISSGKNPLENGTARATIQIDLGQGSGVGLADSVDGGLDAGEEVTLTITTSSGSQTTEVLRAPDPMTDGAVDL